MSGTARFPAAPALVAAILAATGQRLREMPSDHAVDFACPPVPACRTSSEVHFSGKDA